MHFVRTRNQIRKIEALANAGEHVNRSVARQQIEVAAPCKMAFGWPQTLFRLNSEDGVNFSQPFQQPIDIPRFARLDQVDIIRLDWRTVQNRG